MRRLFLILIMIFAVSAVVLIPGLYIMVVRSSEPGVKVGAYYYVWYGEGRHWITAEGYRDTVIDLPVLGYYSSQNETVTKQHLDWMKDIGLDFLIISWWGQDSYEDNSTKVVFKVVNSYAASWIKLAIMVEGFNDTFNGGTGRYNFTDIYAYLNKTYITQYDNIYMKIANKPLVCWFNFPDMTVPYENRLAIYNNSGFEARIVGQSSYVNWWFGTPWSGSAEIQPDVYEDKEICLEPRYDDTHLGWGNHKFDETYSLGLYDVQWNKAIRHAREGDVNIVTIYSWNEFHERSQIEPCFDNTSFNAEDEQFMLAKTRSYISQIRSERAPLSMFPFLYFVLGLGTGVILAAVYFIYKRVA